MLLLYMTDIIWSLAPDMAPDSYKKEYLCIKPEMCPKQLQVWPENKKVVEELGLKR